MNTEITFLQQHLNSAFASKALLAKAIATSPAESALLNKQYEAVSAICTTLHQKLQKERMRQAQKALYYILTGEDPECVEEGESPDLQGTMMEKVCDLLQAEANRTGERFKFRVEGETYGYVGEIRSQAGQGEEHF